MNIGDKVVCLDDTNWLTWMHPHWRVVEGEVYTIRRVVSGRSVNAEMDSGVYLQELFGTINPKSGEEYGIRLSRFRPLYDLCLEQLYAAATKSIPSHGLPKIKANSMETKGK